MINRSARRLTLAGLAAAGAALTLAALPAHAQDTAYDGPSYGRYDGPPPPPPPAYGEAAYDQSGDIVVTAPSYRGRDPATGAPIREFHASRLVSYRDLDIYSPEGARALRWRVEQAAQSACQELDDRIPNGMPDTHECMDQAAHDALRQVRYEPGDYPQW
jgi:UrcA family protein